MITGKKLNERWKVGAKHALYRHSGDWYHVLNKFPGALFDSNGYIIFETEENYYNHKDLVFGQDVHIPRGIASIPGYVQVIIDGLEHIPPRSRGTGGKQKVHLEGKPKTIKLTKYERNPKARADCLKHYGMNCYVCGFNFENIYGAIAKNFIHVHHLIPLPEINDEYIVDPIIDLRPVCPNCHSMIHMRRPNFSIEDIKSMIGKH